MENHGISGFPKDSWEIWEVMSGLPRRGARARAGGGGDGPGPQPAAEGQGVRRGLPGVAGGAARAVRRERSRFQLPF